MEVSTPSGALYFALFVDDFSGWRFIYFLKHKSEAADRFKELINLIRGETGNLVRVLRTDGGGEYSSNDFNAWLKKKGIRHETSAPYTPEQDGVSERAIRTITEGARSCIYDTVAELDLGGDSIKGTIRDIVNESRIPLYLWAEAASFTVYTLNRVFSKAVNSTPYEKWHNRRPNLTSSRIRFHRLHPHAQSFTH